MPWKGWAGYQPKGERRRAKPSPVVEVATVPKRHKYGATPTVVHNIRFASAKEAARYEELWLLERAGAIRDLVLQQVFDLHAHGGALICRYVADFSYLDVEAGSRVVEDVKGMRTRMYRLKARWMHAEYGIDIVEV